jgi:hypothetical protein
MQYLQITSSKFSEKAAVNLEETSNVQENSFRDALSPYCPKVLF